MNSLHLTYSEDFDLIDDYVLRGSHKSANLFVRKYQSFVFNVALRFTKNKHDAEDIAQEVLVKALSNLKNFKKNSSISTWLYRITVNYCKNYLTKKKLKNIFNFDSDFVYNSDYSSKDLNPLEKMENEEFKSKFYKCLELLPEKQRETFALRYFEEMPYEEISQLLGTSVGGLKANYFQAVKKLGVLLNE